MASKEFQFHYVKTPTGSISGQSVLTQTEDAINDLGDYMFEATGDATEALKKATEALNTANTAQQNSAEALSTANAASGKVNSLETIVNSWDATIKDSNAKASQAVSTANAANTKSDQAVSTANSANTKSDQAVKTANTASSTANAAKTNSETAVADALEAKEIAKEAKAIAEEAVVDADADIATMRQLLAETKVQAQTASTSAAASQSSANESADYSTLSQAWAVKTDGKVTENNLPDGAEIDYSSKYYAQQAGSSNSAASASASAAAASQQAAAGSATAAATSEQNAANSATAANVSKTAAAGSATTASTKAAEASASAQKAKDWASKEDGPVEGEGATAEYSAKYYAQQANQSNSVKYVAQTLTAAQQTQARDNIGAASATDVGTLSSSLQTTNTNVENLGNTVNENKTATDAELAKKIPKSGDRGTLSGYETAATLTGSPTININSASTNVMNTSGAVALTFTAAAATASDVKVIALTAIAATTLTIAGAVWANGGSAPTWGTAGKHLVLVANFLGGRVVLNVFDNDEG